jgi:hypothetical protein
MCLATAIKANDDNEDDDVIIIITQFFIFIALTHQLKEQHGSKYKQTIKI